MPNYRTKLHHYNFESGEHPGYKATVRAIEANADGRGHWMNSWGAPDAKGRNRGNVTEEIEVETDCLFANQLNTADGRRVFDWYEEYRQDGRKIGHWVEITSEIAEARRLTLKCGYCGHQYGPHHDSASDNGFCMACLDSEYLKADDLHMLRLQPVCDEWTNGKERAPLTDAERELLTPIYVRRQTTGADSRAKKKRDKQRAHVLEKFAKESAAIVEERDGMLWLWDHGVSLDNVIYYDHTRKFSFGWRSAVSAEVKSALLDLLCEFPFAYEIVAEGEKKATR